MRKASWVRASVVVMLLGGAFASSTTACGTDEVAIAPLDAGRPDDGAIPTPVVDGGKIETSDADAAAVVDAGPPVPKLVFVHAANEAGPVRLCLARHATNGTPDPRTDTLPVVPPLPYKNDKGLGGPANPVAFAPGLGAVLPLDSLDTTRIHLRPVVVKASSLLRVGAGGNAKSCSELLSAAAYGPGAVGSTTKLAEGADFTVLPTIPALTLRTGRTYVALLTGCPGGLGLDTNQTAKCGPGYTDGGGNLRMVVYELDDAPGGAGNVVQFVYGSSHVIPRVVKPFITVSPDAGADGGDRLFLSGGATFMANDTVGPAVPSPGAKVTTPISFATSEFGVQTALGEIAGPVSRWQAFGAQGTADPTFFKAGRGYTFVLVGDPKATLDPAAGDFRGVHLLAFDNDPPVPKI